MSHLPPPPNDDLADLERSTGPGLPKPILIGGIVVLAVVLAIVVMALLSGGGDGDSTPTPTQPAPIGAGETPDGEVVPVESTTTAPLLPPVPEPFSSLDVAPVEGCTYDECTSGLSYTVIGPDNKRQVPLADGATITVTVTVTNTSAFEYLLTGVDRQEDREFSPQLADADAAPPACPMAGDTPLKVAGRAKTECQLTYAFTNVYGLDEPRLTIDAEVQYLTVRSDGSDFEAPNEVTLSSGSKYLTIVTSD